MSEYNVSALISFMKDSFGDSQINTGRTILELVATHPSVNVDVNDKMISKLVNRKSDVHKEIKAGAGRREVISGVRSRIKEEVIDIINPVLMDDTCSQILECMSGDKTVSSGFCNKMQQFYAEPDLVSFFTDAVLYALSKTNLPPEATVQENDFLLLSEANYRCPVNGAKLWKKVKGKYTHVYRVVKIYPDDLDEETREAFDRISLPPRSLDMDDNKIVLCRECAEKYLEEPTPERYAKLLDCKGVILRRHKREQISAETAIEDEIVDIIKAIASIDDKTELQPFTDALEVKEKILPENYLLEVAIRDDVVRYYPFIEKQFSLLDGVEGATFNVIRSEVTTCYEKYTREGLNQVEIFNALADWILESKGLGDKHKPAAAVMVSFFVQNCAVFKKHNISVSGEESNEEESDDE